MVHSNKDIIVVGKIYAEWCGHCQNLKPEWTKMKNNLKNSNVKCEFREIEETNQDNGIQQVNDEYLKNSNTKLALQGGYPTIFKIVNGEIKYYNGERNADSLQKWVTSDLPTKLKGGNKLKRKTVKNKKSNRKTRKGNILYKNCINLFGWFKK